MITNPQQLINDFITDMSLFANKNVNPSQITFDSWAAPHPSKDLPSGKSAVYVFSLTALTKAPAGAHRVIKVGKVGSNSSNRFRYQHYSSRSANSTLAGAIENNPVLWGYIGFPVKNADTGDWLRKNTDRNNFYFSDFSICGAFEVYARAKLGSIYEGSLSGGA